MIGDGKIGEAECFTALDELFDRLGSGERPGIGNVKSEFHDGDLLDVLGASSVIAENVRRIRRIDP